MSKYICEIKNIPYIGGLSISINDKTGSPLNILGTFINIDIETSKDKILMILDNINSIEKNNAYEFKYLGEICAIYVYKKKSLIVDTLSGVNYQEDYDYDFFNIAPPDICDFEEIETSELKKIIELWLNEVDETYYFRS